MRWHRYDVGALSELCRSFRMTPAEAVAPNQMDATAVNVDEGDALSGPLREWG